MVASKSMEDLRASVRAELPELAEVSDSDLRDKVVEAWATALFDSSFNAISEMKASGNPDTRAITVGTQADHMRGVARISMRVTEELNDLFPDLKINRDIAVAGALVHDVGKPWEFDPVNQARWQASPRTTGFPSMRHPPRGLHVCLNAGLPEEIAHIACCHSGEGQLVVRSLEATVVHYADYTFWNTLSAAGLMDDGKQE